MRIAFVNSGLGLLAVAAHLRRRRPDADLVLSMDPDGMPWGPRPPEEITQRTLRCARAATDLGAHALVIACNSASVYALEALRAEFEPRIPVIGTVPAVKRAAASGPRIAVWATVATSGSEYQQRLIREFAAGRQVTSVPCPGLADAVDAGHPERIAQAVASAAVRTPAGTTDVVLGCTEYELIPEAIGAALPGGVRLHGSADAIVAQVLRRAPVQEAGSGRLDVLLSGRLAALPEAASHYVAGRAVLPSRAPGPAAAR